MILTQVSVLLVSPDFLMQVNPFPSRHQIQRPNSYVQWTDIWLAVNESFMNKIYDSEIHNK